MPRPSPTCTLDGSLAEMMAFFVGPAPLPVGSTGGSKRPCRSLPVASTPTPSTFRAGSGTTRGTRRSADDDRDGRSPRQNRAHLRSGFREQGGSRGRRHRRGRADGAAGRHRRGRCRPTPPMVALAASFPPVGLFLVRRLGPTPVAWSVWATGFARWGGSSPGPRVRGPSARGRRSGSSSPRWGLLVVVLLRFPDAPRRGGGTASSR